MDPNGKVGWNVILRHIKGNFYLILLKETIRNASDFCEKNPINSTEEIIIVCQEMLLFLKSIKIDENNVLTSYSRKKSTPSDHISLIGNFNSPWNSQKKMQQFRYEMFNFKDLEGLEKYKEMTYGTVKIF